MNSSWSVAPCALFNSLIPGSPLLFLLSSPHSLQRNDFSLLCILKGGTRYCTAMKGECKKPTQTLFMWFLHLFGEKWEKKIHKIVWIFLKVFIKHKVKTKIK